MNKCFLHTPHSLWQSWQETTLNGSQHSHTTSHRRTCPGPQSHRWPWRTALGCQRAPGPTGHRHTASLFRQVTHAAAGWRGGSETRGDSVVPEVAISFLLSPFYSWIYSITDSLIGKSTHRLTPHNGSQFLRNTYLYVWLYTYTYVCVYLWHQTTVYSQCYSLHYNVMANAMCAHCTIPGPILTSLQNMHTQYCSATAEAIACYTQYIIITFTGGKDTQH